MLYLLVALGIGLLISSAVKSQFVASQMTILVTFLPAVMLSGFLFDLSSMPVLVRMITYVLPARYYVALLQTMFLAGDIWPVILPNMVVLAVMAAVLLLLTRQVDTETIGVSIGCSMRLFRILALTRKELLAILKDPRSRYNLLIPPILQCLIYGYVATYDLNDVPYAVLDQDRSAASQQLLARFDGSGVFRRVANLSRAADVADDDQRAAGVAGACRSMPGLRAPAAHRAARRIVQVIADGRNSNTAGHGDGLRRQHRRIVQRIVGARITVQPASPIRVTTRAWYNPNLETRWHMIPALIGTLTLIQCLMLTGLSVAREREQGTFDQLLVTPFRPVEIMVGKALPPMLVGIVQATLVLLVAQLWFRIPFAGSFVTLYVGLSFVFARRRRHGTLVVVGCQRRCSRPCFSRFC